jgi:hypothetical protein
LNGSGTRPGSHRFSGRLPAGSLIIHKSIPQVLPVEKVVFHQAVHRPDRILHADLLPFFVGSSVIGDAHFVDADLREAGDLRGHFGFEAEAFLLEPDLLDEFGAEELVAGLHIGQVQVGEHVGEQRQETVPDGVPEKEDAVGLPAHETRAVDYVGKAVEDRLQQDVELLRVIFEVGILDHDVIARCQFDPFVKRGALAHVHRLLEQPDRLFGVGGDVFLHDRYRPVFAAVVDNDDLFPYIADQLHCQYFIEDRGNRSLLVVGRDQDAE